MSLLIKKSHKLEWKLSENVFYKALSMLNVNCNIDLFVSRLNYQLTPFVSYKPDPEVMSVDAFTINWKSWNFYAFPPFALITRVLQKICVDEATGVIIVPLWSTQAFFPTLMNMLVSIPIFIHRKKDLPAEPNLTHPLHHKLHLLACQVSGDTYKQQAFQQTLRTSSCTHGDQQPTNNTITTSVNGQTFALKETKVPFMHL